MFAYFEIGDKLIFVGVFVCLDVGLNGQHVDGVHDDLIIVWIQLLAGFLHEHENRLAAIIRKVEKRPVQLQVALPPLGALVRLRFGFVQGARRASPSCSWRRGGGYVTIIIVVTVRLLNLCLIQIVREANFMNKYLIVLQKLLDLRLHYFLQFDSILILE